MFNLLAAIDFDYCRQVAETFGQLALAAFAGFSLLKVVRAVMNARQHAAEDRRRAAAAHAELARPGPPRFNG
jgi:hypothetical protein